MIQRYLSENTSNKVKKLFYKYPQVEFDKNQTIIPLGEAPSGVYYLKSGNVKLSTTTVNGTDVLLHIFVPGSYFPLMWAIAEIPNQYLFETLDSSVVHVVPKKDFSAFIKNEKEVLFELTQRLLLGMNGLLTRTELFSQGKGSEKVISTLIYLSKHFGNTNGTTVIIEQRFTHSDIANFAGLARETTSIELNKLRDKGLINYSGKFIKIESITNLKKELLKV